jgi:hypothetical protein
MDSTQALGYIVYAMTAYMLSYVLYLLAKASHQREDSLSKSPYDTDRLILKRRYI